MGRPGRLRRPRHRAVFDESAETVAEESLAPADQLVAAAGVQRHEPNEATSAFVTDVIRQVEGSCPHLAQPQPMYVFAMIPALPCAGCAVKVDQEVAGTAEDRRCERCGTEQNEVTVMRATREVVTVQAGLCDGCADELGAE